MKSSELSLPDTWELFTKVPLELFRSLQIISFIFEFGIWEDKTDVIALLRKKSKYLDKIVENKDPSPDVESVVLDEDDGVIPRHDSAVEHFSALVCL